MINLPKGARVLSSADVGSHEVVEVGVDDVIAALDPGSSGPPRCRRHRLARGECPYCDEQVSEFHPPHDASDRCESGGRSHCSCDVCF